MNGWNLVTWVIGFLGVSTFGILWRAKTLRWQRIGLFLMLLIFVIGFLAVAVQLTMIILSWNLKVCT